MVFVRGFRNLTEARLIAKVWIHWFGCVSFFPSGNTQQQREPASRLLAGRQGGEQARVKAAGAEACIHPAEAAKHWVPTPGGGFPAIALRDRGQAGVAWVDEWEWRVVRGIVRAPAPTGPGTGAASSVQDHDEG